MADLQTVTIDPSKIKVRWEEPYSSEGVNRGMSLIPRGVYRGFVPYEAAVPDKTFILRIDPTGSDFYYDSALLYVDRTNGFGLAVRDATEPVFDMSAQFTGPGGTIPGDKTWIIWADVDYSTGITTTGDYHVTLDGDPLPKDAIIIGKVTMDAGATNIRNLNLYLAGSGRTLPYPTKREDGVYVAGDQYMGFMSGEEAWNVPTSDHKRAMDSAATAPTASNPFVTKADSSDRYFAEPHFDSKVGLSGTAKIQIFGQLYIGKTTHAEALRLFSLRNYLNKRQQLYEAGYGQKVYVSAIYKSNDSGVVDPLADADSQGFYTNPYIYFNIPYTGDLYVQYYRKKQFSSLEQAPVQAFPFAGMPFWPHSSEVMGRSASGSPDSLGYQSIEEQVSSLLGLVNARIKTVHPTASALNWILLWRSGNVTLDADVRKDTVSMYWMNGKLAILVGGYFNSATQVTSGISVDESVILHMWNQDEGVAGELFAAKHEATASTAWDWADRNNWTQWNAKPINLASSPDGLAKVFSHEPTDAGVVNWNILMGALPEGDGWAFCFNCGLDEDAYSGKWIVGDDAINSTAIILTNSGMSIGFKKLGDNTTPWLETEWTSKLTWGLDSSLARLNSAPTMDNSAQDRVRASMGGTIVDPAHTGTIPMHVFDGVSWHAVITDIDSGDVSLTNITSIDITNLTIQGVTAWGCMVRGESNGSEGDVFYWDGYVDVSFDEP